jgi:hypothetical protein
LDQGLRPIATILVLVFDFLLDVFRGNANKEKLL